MLKLFTLKEKDETKKTTGGGKKTSAAQLRVQKGLANAFMLVKVLNKILNLLKYLSKH